jgi:hypothetical protein
MTTVAPSAPLPRCHDEPAFQRKAMKVLPDKAKAAFHRHQTEPGSTKQ